MRTLLDTHVFLWWLADDPRLSPACRDQLATSTDPVLISAVSIWEMAIKVSIGKLTMRKKDLARLADLVPLCGFSELPVTARHAARVKDLPYHHTDPFDRLLVAQAQMEKLTVVTADHTLAAYGIPTFDPT